MPPKTNPKNLNALQLRTLAIFQRLATQSPDERAPGAENGISQSSYQTSEVTLYELDLPKPHGDHFHVGSAVVLTRNASGLQNLAVWEALQRKGLLKNVFFPFSLTITSEGLNYSLGPLDMFIEHSAH